MGQSGVASLLVSLLASSVEAQSLAEVAKRERERRAEVGESGRSTAVITEQDLSPRWGPTPSASRSGTRSARPALGLRTPSGIPAAPPEEAPGPAEDAERSLTAREIADLRVEWTRIWEGQMAQAELDLEKARDDSYQCRAAERYFFVPLAIDCEGVGLRLAAAEARYRKVKANRFHWELLLPENQDP